MLRLETTQLHRQVSTSSDDSEDNTPLALLAPVRTKRLPQQPLVSFSPFELMPKTPEVADFYRNRAASNTSRSSLSSVASTASSSDTTAYNGISRDFVVIKIDDDK